MYVGKFDIWREKETCLAHIVKTSETLEQEENGCVRSLQRCRSTTQYMRSWVQHSWHFGREAGSAGRFWFFWWASQISGWARMHVLNWEHKRLCWHFYRWSLQTNSNNAKIGTFWPWGRRRVIPILSLLIYRGETRRSFTTDCFGNVLFFHSSHTFWMFHACLVLKI